MGLSGHRVRKVRSLYEVGKNYGPEVIPINIYVAHKHKCLQTNFPEFILATYSQI